MKIKDYIVFFVVSLFLAVTHGLTYKVSHDKTVTEVVDNMTAMCYNGSGAVVETNHPNVFILCKTVIAELDEAPPQRNLQRGVDRSREV